MLKDKSLLEYRNLFFLNQYEENDNMVQMKKIYRVICGKYRNL